MRRGFGQYCVQFIEREWASVVVGLCELGVRGKRDGGVSECVLELGSACVTYFVEAIGSRGCFDGGCRGWAIGDRA